MHASFWKGKVVLITGARGFIGSHLTHVLRSFGATVIAVTRTGGDDTTVAANIASMSQLEAVFAGSPIYACFHLAAEALVESGQTSPYKTFKNNFLGTLNVLELSHKYQVERIVIASTVHVYGDAPAPTDETVLPRPSRPYETSKTNTDLIAQSYADRYNLPVLIPRFVNIYGPGDTNFSRLIPKTIRSVLGGVAPELWGGTVERDFLYIEDAIEAFLALGELPPKAMDKNRIFNFGTGNIVTVKEVVEKIIAISGKNVAIAPAATAREHEVSRQFVTWEKAKKVLGWEPKTELDEGLRKTIAWYSSYQAR